MIERELSRKVDKFSKTRKVVMVTGPRQVGKTTMLKMLADNDRKYISLDDLSVRKLAQDALNYL